MKLIVLKTIQVDGFEEIVGIFSSIAKAKQAVKARYPTLRWQRDDVWLWCTRVPVSYEFLAMAERELDVLDAL